MVGFKSSGAGLYPSVSLMSDFNLHDFFAVTGGEGMAFAVSKGGG